MQQHLDPPACSLRWGGRLIVSASGVRSSTVNPTSSLALYLRSRHVILVTAGSVAVPLAAAAIGLRSLPVGVHGGVPLGAPLWAYLPILSGALVGMSWSGQWETFDRSASRAMSPLNCAFVMAATLAAMGVAILVCLAAGTLEIEHLTAQGGLELGIATARNVLGFVGLCVLGSRILGTGLCWLPAIASVFVFEWFGRDGEGAAYAWAFPVAPPGELTGWLVAVGLWALGMAAIGWSDWTRSRLQRVGLPRVWLTPDL